MNKVLQTKNLTFTGIVAVVLIIPALFYDTSVSMIEIWIENETFTHGFLILPISFWLMWQKKHKIIHYSIKPEFRITILLIPILGIWLIAKIVDVQVVQQLALITLIPVSVWLLFGKEILLTFTFPLLYLFFAVPLGQSLIPFMMEFTANFTVALINMTGIPIYREGLYFSLPSGNWSVVEECSGVRYIIASFALGAIYAYTNYNVNRKRLIFILFSLLVPVIANGIRAFGIVMIGHFSGMELATGVDHILYGWVFFGIVIFLMFYIGSYWWDPIDKPQTKQKNTALLKTSFPKKRFLIAVTLILISILSVKILANRSSDYDQLALSNIDFSLPNNFEEWQFESNYSLGWKPIITNPDVYLHHGYRFGNDFVQLDIGYYKLQRENAETISTQNKLSNPYGDQWKTTHTTDWQEQDVYVTETTLQQRGQKILVWNWYQVGVQNTPNAYIAKVFEAYNKLRYNREDAAYITLATPWQDTKEISRTKLRNFLSAASAHITKSIGEIATREQTK